MLLVSRSFILPPTGQPHELLAAELAALLAGTAPCRAVCASPLRMIHGVINLTGPWPWLELVLHRALTLDDSGYLMQRPGATVQLLPRLTEARGESLKIVKLAHQFAAAGTSWISGSVEQALSESLLLGYHRTARLVRVAPPTT